MIQKPLNLNPPPRITAAITDEFDQMMESFQKEARGARASRQSAQGLTDLVASALSEAELSI